MPSASAIRLQIEDALSQCISSALTPAQRIIRPVAPTGIPAVDALLDGGFPIGAITEIVGPESSGRTALAISYVARCTQAGNVCAWIDVGDALHPESAAAAGIDLSRLLWIRCGVIATAKELCPSSFVLPERYFMPPPVKQGLHGGGFGPHPRNEAKGLPDAVSGLLQPEPRYTEPPLRRRPEKWRFEAPQPPLTRRAWEPSRGRRPWTRIEQALKTTDLLLQGGGFGALVLDMGSVAPQHVSRVEQSIWFRYRAAVERSQTSLLLLSQYSCAKSAGELLLRLHPGGAQGNEATVFTGIEHRLEVERRRFATVSTNVIPLKKPSQRETTACWSSHAVWAGAR